MTTSHRAQSHDAVEGVLANQVPRRRFDVVWTFDFDPVTNKYSFNQQAQLLLQGDLPPGCSGKLMRHALRGSRVVEKR